MTDTELAALRERLEKLRHDATPPVEENLEAVVARNLAGDAIDLATRLQQRPADGELAALLKRADEHVTDIISHEEAGQMLARFCASHFDNSTEHARVSIPANPSRDDDLRLHAYIKQQRVKDARLRAATAAWEAQPVVVMMGGESGTHWAWYPPGYGHFPIGTKLYTAPPEQGWREIESAPRGEFVLVAAAEKVSVASLYTDDGVRQPVRWHFADQYMARFTPTHWMSLPAPPATL